jgi:tetratricopeptide (TPR) repeat protein
MNHRVIGWAAVLLVGFSGGALADSGLPVPSAPAMPDSASLQRALLVLNKDEQFAYYPALAGLQAVASANDLLKSQGPDKAIDFFQSVLNVTNNRAVERMIRFELVNLYEQTNRPDLALEQLKQVITQIPEIPSPTPTILQVVPTDAGTAAPIPPQ